MGLYPTQLCGCVHIPSLAQWAVPERPDRSTAAYSGGRRLQPALPADPERSLQHNGHDDCYTKFISCQIFQLYSMIQMMTSRTLARTETAK